MDNYFSIIVPVYKCEKYLSSCILSVLNQDYKLFELILVDDGSPDNAGAICDEYSKLDNRIKTIHKENNGPASARNAGIKLAKGNYLLFLDSDDLMADNALEQLSNLVSDKSDIILASYNEFYESNNEEVFVNLNFNTDIMLSNRSMEILQNLLLTNSTIWSVWRHAYSRDFIIDNSIFFDENLFGTEDCDFFVKTILAAQSFQAGNFPLCNYRISAEDSITTAPKLKYIRSCFETSKFWFYYFYDLFTNHNEKTAEKIMRRFANMFIDAIAIAGGVKNQAELSKEVDIIKSNLSIMNHVMGWKHKLSRLIIKSFNINNGMIILNKLNRFNIFLHKNFGTIYKKTYRA